MLQLLLGIDWTKNRDAVLARIAGDVHNRQGNRILLVPELISHETERRLCAAAGDTASRYAEVLSFSRLAVRVADAIGCAPEPCLDNGGRVVAMAAAARMLSSRLKAYAAVETKPEFLMGLLDAVDEFKRCCISPADLLAASKMTDGSLAQKLEELSLLLESYDGLCSRGKRDPRDRMRWLLEQMEETDFGREYVFYIDGFPDFTRQHMAILEHLIRVCPLVVVSLNCDVPNSRSLAFEKAGQTAGQLLQLAKRAGVEVRIDMIPGGAGELESVRELVFQGKITPQSMLNSHLQLFRTQSLWQECSAAAEQILDWVRAGARFRDIGVVCTDMGKYRALISLLFHRCSIPAYLSGTEDILEKSVVSTILSALEAAAGDLEQRDVLHYLRSVLSPLDVDACDLLENYAVVWNIGGRLWREEWHFHPDGLGAEWTQAAQNRLAALNDSRIRGVMPLVRLQDALSRAVTLAQQIEALYAFLEDISLAQRLGSTADRLEKAGDGRTAQEWNQLWEILIGAMEQMYDVLGQTAWDTQSFLRLFRLLLSQYDVGTIPTVLDSVSVGPVSAMRCQEHKYRIILGAVEGSLPGYGGSSGILSDQERVALRKLGVPLTGGAMEGLQAEFGEIYGVICGAREALQVYCPAGQPSLVYRRLLEMTGSERRIDTTMGAAIADPVDAAAWLLHQGSGKAAAALGLQAQVDALRAQAEYRLGNIERDGLQGIYGGKLRLSASQIDRLAECRLSYFLKYGLRLQERKVAAVDPAEFGTYVHAVLEQTAREVMQRGGFAQVSLEETMRIASGFAEDYAAERFRQLDSQRIAYLFQRNRQELEMVVQDLWEELSQSAFVPVGFEVEFSDHADMPPISVDGAKMEAELRGFVDRTDRWQGPNGNFFRVVDYKTGRKDFDYCDVFNGVGLQMLLYLFALEAGGDDLLGCRPIPAGVQYFPARVPVMSADGHLTEEETEKLRAKEKRRKGLLLDDEAVLQAMEPGETPVRTGYSTQKDGSRSGDLADRQQLRQLKEYLYQTLRKLVDEIASGDVTPNPYTRGSSHDACAFCPYGAVCHKNEVSGRRNYQAMTAQRFWEEIGKEVGTNG